VQNSLLCSLACCLRGTRLPARGGMPACLYNLPIWPQQQAPHAAAPCRRSDGLQRAALPATAHPAALAAAAAAAPIAAAQSHAPAAL
jgi:hypothetical protein